MRPEALTKDGISEANLASVTTGLYVYDAYTGPEVHRYFLHLAIWSLIGLCSALELANMQRRASTGHVGLMVTSPHDGALAPDSQGRAGEETSKG